MFRLSSTGKSPSHPAPDTEFFTVAAAARESAWATIADPTLDPPEECYAMALKAELDRLWHPADQGGIQLLGHLMAFYRCRSAAMQMNGRDNGTEMGGQDDLMELKSHIVNATVESLRPAERDYIRSIFNEEAALGLAANMLHFSDQAGAGLAGHQAIEMLSLLSLFAGKLFPNGGVDEQINQLKFKPVQGTPDTERLLEKYCQM